MRFSKFVKTFNFKYASEKLFTVIIYDIGISSFPVPGNVWFSLRNKTTVCVILEKIGEGHDALVYVTNLTICCQLSHPYGNWFFPNGTRVPSHNVNWDIYRIRGHMLIYLHHKRGGMQEIYGCEMPDSANMTH